MPSPEEQRARSLEVLLHTQEWVLGRELVSTHSPGSGCLGQRPLPSCHEGGTHAAQRLSEPGVCLQGSMPCLAHRDVPCAEQLRNCRGRAFRKQALGGAKCHELARVAQQVRVAAESGGGAQPRPARTGPAGGRAPLQLGAAAVGEQRVPAQTDVPLDRADSSFAGRLRG